MSWRKNTKENVKPATNSWKENRFSAKSSGASWATSKEAARKSGASWEARVAPSDPNRVPSWSNAIQKDRKGSAVSWGTIPSSRSEPLVRSSWSDSRSKVFHKRCSNPNVQCSLDDQINDMIDAFNAGDPSMGHVDEKAVLAKIDLENKKEIVHTSVGEIEKGLVGYFIMIAGIFNAFRDSMPTVFPAAFFGDETYQKAQQTGNEINDEITKFVAEGKASGASKQLLSAMAEYGQHDPQYANLRRAFAQAEKKNARKSEKQLVDEIQVSGSTEEDSVKLHHYAPKVGQLMDYGMKSFLIDEISIGSFITRTEKSFIPFVQTLRPNVGFILHILNFIPALDTPDNVVGFLAKKAAHIVDKDNSHLEPLFNKVFLAVYPVIQPVLSFFASLIKMFKPAMNELLNRSHLVAAITDRVLKYVMVLAGMIWSVFAGIVHFIVQLVLFIVQLVIQVLVSIYASPWVGELVNLALTLVTSLV